MLDGKDLQLLGDLLDQKLDEKLKPIQTDIAELKEDVNVLKEDVGVLKVEMKEVKQDIVELKEEVNVLKEDVNDLKQDSAELKMGVRKLNDDLRNLRIDHSRVEKKIDDYYARIEKTYVTEKEDRSDYQKELRASLDRLIRKARLVCPLSPHLIAYMSLQVAHEGWSIA